MNAIHTLLRPIGSLDFFAAMRRLALAGICLAFAACGGSANPPPPPESVPVVLTQPADQSVVVGGAASFSVAATGAIPLAYQWASSTDGTTFIAIAGATSGSYSTGATALSQSGSFYRVVVSNSLGSATSSAARLTVTPAVVAPAITVQPADQTVTAPATAIFNVSATGTAPVYEWQLSSDAGVTFSPLAGAPSAPNLSVVNTTPAQSGQRYRVRVSNAAGSVTSDAALLTVNAASSAPLFTTQPSAQAIVAGATASFTVVASGTPAPALQWRINGVNLADGAQAGGVCVGAGVTGASSAALTLTSVPIGCSGAVFSAVASNGVSPDATSDGAVLTVTAAPPSAAFDTPHGVAVDSAGNLYVADTGNHTIRKITPAGVVTTLAGQAGNAGSADGTGGAARFNVPRGLAVDAAGNVYVADTFNETVRVVTPAGVVSTLAGLAGTGGSVDGTGSAARFTGPSGVAVDAAGNVYVADTVNQTIRKITPAGSVSTLAGLAGAAGSVDGTGSAARFANPRRVAADAAGNVYVVDLNHTLRKITVGGVVSTLAGLAGVTGSADGTGSGARFADPQGVAVDAAGNVYVGDTANRTIRKVTPAGDVTTLAGQAGASGNADGTGSAARFARPRGVAVDAAGNVYVADTDNASIRKITPAGVVTTIAQ